MKSHKKLLLSTITLAVLALTSQARAEEPVANPGDAAQDADRAQEKINAVIITGSTSLKRTVRESSVAVTVAEREDLDRKAPRSTASALELIPGITVEDSGGEVSNNYTARGLPGQGQNFVQLQEDGLPIFYHPGLVDTILKQELSIDRLEAVRGGTSGILTVQGAGATINFITFRAKDEPEGMIRLTGSDYGTKRIDARYGGALGGGWYAGFGGFFRSSDSVRDVGFTADRGGLFRAYLGRKLRDGEFSVDIKLVDDHNTFLTPTPFEDAKNPRPVAGFDGNYGTMIGPDNAVSLGRNSNGTQINDATEGVATKSTSIGYRFEQKIADDVTLRAKGRYTDFKNEFNAIFTYDNDSLRLASDRLDPARNADVAAMLARFSGTTAAIRSVADGAIYAGAGLAAVGGNGLVTDNIAARNRQNKQAFVNDVSVNWTAGNSSLTVGYLAIDQRQWDSNDGNTRFLGEVRHQPARLDIVAVDAAGKVVGQLSDKGKLQYSPWGAAQNTGNLKSDNLYINEEFKVSDRLRIDGGARFESLKVTKWQGGASSKPIPGAFNADGSDADTIIVNNVQNVADGSFNKIAGKQNERSLTVGANYLVNDNLATYARYATSYQAQEENPVTDLAFAELGLRYKQKGFAAGLTAFRTKFDNYRFSRLLVGETLETSAVGNMIIHGLEFDLLWHPLRHAQVTATGVVQKSRMSIASASGPQASTLGSFGNKPERSPDVNLTITPSLFLPGRKGEVYVSFHHVGRRFADAANSFVLPAYEKVDIGARYQISPSLSFNVNVQNVGNTIGLTEGNPRAGFKEATGGNFFYARAILGRNLQASLSASF